MVMELALIACNKSPAKRCLEDDQAHWQSLGSAPLQLSSTA